MDDSKITAIIDNIVAGLNTKLNEGFDKVEQRFDEIKQRLDKVDHQLDKAEQSLNNTMLNYA